MDVITGCLQMLVPRCKVLILIDREHLTCEITIHLYVMGWCMVFREVKGISCIWFCEYFSNLTTIIGKCGKHFTSEEGVLECIW